jgi:acyl carrier protein
MSDANERISRRVAEILHRPVAAVTADTELGQLAGDSFVLVELVLQLQDEFGVRFDHADVQSLQTVGDVVRLVESRSRPGSPQA